MDSAKAELADKIKASSNILVTVSRNPSADQLSALLGLALTLNKMGKHAAAVFSGQVPSTLEFLQPEDTFEKNTDSLRDFIIALDKSKADKLRYKVEDDVVRIFITPYKTSISDADLEFSQGDFNVDVVVGIGVREQEDLDEAITAHGRILHDATVATINLTPDSGLGSINWYDEHVSSLSELVTELVQSLGNDLLDEQISTALLTGIVAETDRFSNEKTSAQTMSLSAALMAAGANQQLVATKLEEPLKPNNDWDEGGENGGSLQGNGDSSDNPKPDDGTLEIDHVHDDKDDQPEDSQDQPSFDLPSPQPEDQPEQPQEPQQREEAEFPGVTIDEQPQLEAVPQQPSDALSPGPKLILDPPSLGGTLTANSEPEGLDPSVDPLTLSSEPQPTILSRDSKQTVAPAGMTPPPDNWTPPAPAAPLPVPDLPSAPEPPVVQDFDAGDKTLTELEASVGSPHLSSPDLGGARDEVSRALSGDSSATTAPEPIAALNAQPLGDSLHASDAPAPENSDPAFIGPMLEDILGPQKPADPPAPAPPAPAPAASPAPAQPPADPPADQPQVIDPNAPPPVPPPIPFKFG